MTSTTLQENVQTIVKELKDTYFEREEMIESCILALLTGNHHFSLGPPGTAKSQLVRDLSSRLKGSQHFEVLLNRLLPAEAVLGPLDLPLLRDTGAFVRKTQGYLPEADTAYLDEIGNVSATLGHSMHSLLNERLFHEVTSDGKSVRTVPLMTAFTSGNTIPGAESEDSAALWDRILLRCEVSYIKSGASFNNLFNWAADGGGTTVDWSELKKAITDDIPFIPIPPKVIDLLLEVRGKLADTIQVGDSGIVLSDRRWKACASVLRANAWLNGRDQVMEKDLLVLKYVLWNEPHEIPVVERLLVAFADRLSDQLRTLKDEMAEMTASIHERKGHSIDQRRDHGTTLLRKLRGVKQELIRLQTENPKSDEAKVVERVLSNLWTDLFENLMDQAEPARFSSWYSKKD